MNTSQRNDKDREFAQFRKEFEDYKLASETRVKEQLKRIQELEQLSKLRDAFGEFQFKDVIFNTVAGADTEITHNLSPADPELVRAIPVMWEFITIPVDPPYIYRPGQSNRRPWGPGYIILRCNIASAVVRMLLVTESR